MLNFNMQAGGVHSGTSQVTAIREIDDDNGNQLATALAQRVVAIHQALVANPGQQQLGALNQPAPVQAPAMPVQPLLQQQQAPLQLLVPIQAGGMHMHVPQQQPPLVQQQGLQQVAAPIILQEPPQQPALLQQGAIAPQAIPPYQPQIPPPPIQRFQPPVISGNNMQGQPGNLHPPVPLSQSEGFRFTQARPQMAQSASLQNIGKTQLVTVPDYYGIPRVLPANDYQVRAVCSILTGEPMTFGASPPQSSLGSLPSGTSVHSSYSSFSSSAQQQPWNQMSTDPAIHVRQLLQQMEQSCSVADLMRIHQEIDATLMHIQKEGNKK